MEGKQSKLTGPNYHHLPRRYRDHLRSLCFGKPHGLADCTPGSTRRRKPEIDKLDLEDVVFYLQSLAPPPSRFETEADHKKGFELFIETKCKNCHTPGFKTAKQALIPALSGQTIHPYTNPLLHNLRDGLADNRSDFEAKGKECPTPPF